MAAHYNFKSYHFLQPSAWTVDVKEFDYENLRFSNRGIFYNKFYDEVLKLYNSAQLYHIKVFDLRNALKIDKQNNNRIFIDTQHLSAFGNHQISNAIHGLLSN